MTQARLQSFDGARVVLAVVLLVFHYASMLLPHYPEAILLVEVLRLSTDVFFAMSGYILAATSHGEISNGKSYADYIVRRLSRIYPLYFLITIFSVAWLVMPGLAGLRNDAGAIEKLIWLPHNLLLVQSWGIGVSVINVPTWSLSALFLMYLLFPWLYRLVKRVGYAFYGVIFLMALVLEMLVQRLFGYSLVQLGFDLGIARAAVPFCFGVAYAILPFTVRRRYAFPSIVILAALFVGNPLISGSLLRLAFVFLILIEIRREDIREYWRPLAALAPLGRYSYAIFLLHIPVLQALYRVSGLTTASPPLYLLLLTCASALVVAAISVPTHWLLEMPSRRFVLSLWFKRPGLKALEAKPVGVSHAALERPDN